MAWNPSPAIADLRALSRKWHMKQIVVLAIDPDRKVFAVHSYGETKALCDRAKVVNEQIFNLVANDTIKIE